MEKNFIKLLTPKNIHHNKKRIGPLEDGGYVMSEEVMQSVSTLMTYGVGHDSRYEEEFSSLYDKPVFLFDHTTGVDNWERGNLKFMPEGLGYNEKCKEWYEHYMEMGITGNIMLKIDIEGYEYEYFKKTDISKMASYVSGILLEVHWIDSISNREELVEILNKIEQHFSLIHIHGNNWGGTWEHEEMTIPKVFELSFVNKKLIKQEEIDNQEYPIQGLDVPNKPDAADYKLDFIKPIKTKTHSLQDVYNYFPTDFFNQGIKALHHNGPTSLLMDSEFFNEKQIKLSQDMVIIQVNDELHAGLSKINKLPFENKNQIIELIEEPYEKWISKPRALLNYITENYNSLPEYIMYVDSSDVVIIEDILNPKEMLEFYNCKVLFNCEPNFASTGFGLPSHDFYDDLFGRYLQGYKKLNLQKYKVEHEQGLNAGVFLGRKDFIVKMLEDACKYMSSDTMLGFPYGCMDDQYMFRYLQIKYFNEISCDVYNKFFLFAFPNAIESDETHWEHYNYFKKHNIHLYQLQESNTGENIPASIVPTKPKVVVTLTTIPSRLTSNYEDNIKSCLDSLLNQTFQEYEIHLNIPYKLNLTGEEYIIPQWLDDMVANNKRLKYFRGEDYGSITKLVDTIKRIEDPECVIVTADDDLIYHPDMVEEQYNNQTKIFHDCAVGYDGIGALDQTFRDNRNNFVVSVPCNVRVNVLQHYKTVSYKRRYFESDFFTDFINASWADDIMVSAYMTKQNIKKYVTYYEKEDIPVTIQEWETRGGVTTFPVLRHTQHDSLEGCNIHRANGNSDNFMEFVKKGYLR